jgi:hypothetical protein
MTTPRIHDINLDDVEDTWWLSSCGGKDTCHSLPDTSKWLCKIEETPGGPSRLKVIAAGSFYHFSRFYTSLFMLLDLHHMSSFAEVIRLGQLPCDSPMIIRHLKNVKFIDRLRLHILTTHESSLESQDEEVSNPYLMRWVLRFIHSIPNSKTLRNLNAQKLSEIYQSFEREKYGSWKMGERHLSLIKTGVNNSLALYKFVTAHEAMLVDAAQMVYTYALSDHIRAKGEDEIACSSTGWVRNIRQQMEFDKFHLPTEGPEARKRGRPKKVMEIFTPNAETSTMATRSQSKNKNNMSAIDSLFSEGCLTSSPKKIKPKVIHFIHSLVAGFNKLFNRAKTKICHLPNEKNQAYVISSIYFYPTSHQFQESIRT